MNYILVFILLVILVSPDNLTAQDKYLVIRNNAESIDSIRFSSSDEANTILQNKIDALIADNFLEASLDSIWIDSLTQNVFADIHIGPVYSFENILRDSLDESLIQKTGVREISTRENYLRFRSRYTAFFAENGYPFARLRLSNYQSDSSHFSGYLILDRGPRVLIDSIRLNGPQILSKQFLESYLDIEEGSEYRHSRIRQIERRIQRLEFIQQYKSPELRFYGDYATIDLYLQEKQSGRFDFLFGIIPTSNFDDRSVFLSLDLTAEFINRLGAGEYFFIDYERLRPEQQKFQLNINYPYILSLDYGLDIDFSIFRNSLEFQTLYSDIGIEYLLNADDKIKLSWNYESSEIIELDTIQLLSTGKLPQDLDVSQTGISAQISINRLDYKFNPSSGSSLFFKATAGRKSIKRNTSILQLESEEYDFSQAYDSLDLKSSRFQLIGNFRNYIRISNRGSLGSSIRAAWRYSKAGLFRNEKFQIGGNKLLRGFDEARFFTSYYMVGSIEYKLLLSQDSYISVPFIDFAVLQDDFENTQWALGLGAGLGLRTNAGVFVFSVAVGRTKTEDFDWRRPKAHFGYVSTF